MLDQEVLLEKAMEEVGGFGRVQWLAFALLTASALSVGMWWYNIAFLMLSPQYECVFSGQSAPTQCTEEDICASDSAVVSWQIDWSSDESLKNLYQ